MFATGGADKCIKLWRSSNRKSSMSLFVLRLSSLLCDLTLTYFMVYALMVHFMVYFMVYAL